jgi:hypothetical protein
VTLIGAFLSQPMMTSMESSPSDIAVELKVCGGAHRVASQRRRVSRHPSQNRTERAKRHVNLEPADSCVRSSRAAIIGG